MENFVVYRAKFGDYLTRAPQMELAHAAVVAKGRESSGLRSRASHARSMRPELKTVRKICCSWHVKPTFF